MYACTATNAMAPCVRDVRYFIVWMNKYSTNGTEVEQIVYY